MKIGMSTYCFRGAFMDGRLDLPGIVRTAAGWGVKHMEIMPMTVNFLERRDILEAVKSAAKDSGVEPMCYTFGANFLTAGKDAHDISGEERHAEIERVKKHIDIAAELGVKLVRHDIGHRPKERTTTRQFDLDLPLVAEVCGEVADYAARYGIVTNLENHGRHFQGSERVHRLVDAVARPNFRCVVDVGNFCAVDEDPVPAVMNNLDIASMFHFKDNYIRDRVPDPENWSVSKHGRYLHGAIVGYGDIDLPRIVDLIRSSGFDGFVSLEYASNEIESLFGARRSWECVRALFA